MRNNKGSQFAICYLLHPDIVSLDQSIHVLLPETDWSRGQCVHCAVLATYKPTIEWFHYGIVGDMKASNLMRTDDADRLSAWCLYSQPFLFIPWPWCRSTFDLWPSTSNGAFF